MKTRLFIAAASIILLSGTACKKSKSSNTVVTPDSTKGTITITNKTNDPYAIYLNAAYQGILAANKSANYTVVYGHYICDVVESGGYGVRHQYSDYVTTTANWSFSIDN